ncbi:N-acetylmuramic acid 6-phosphate etherase [Chlorobiota bacterium]|nr:N-acetylmuramic acid 6-phosphate etherase [Chlorobiota bacterium]
MDIITEQFKVGGRLFYVGAGTSGRLGIVDASECPPTFGTEPGMVQGIIAGGEKAIFKAQEGAEDSPEHGAQALIENNVNHKDVICGIAASGRTPFVRGALDKAISMGCHTILVTTNSREQLHELGVNAETVIAPHVGPEVIAGSTRMKSGTAQKMILNMLTTASMIRLGKSYGNIMVDLQLTNAKLRERAKRIIMEIADVEYEKASAVLEAANGHVKTALVMLLADVDAQTATEKLLDADGFIKNALQG